MKKIFVTVAEFLENGGNNLQDRKCFSYQSGSYGENRYYPLGNILTFGNDDTVEIENLGDVFVYPTIDTYVEIECTPIYA